LENGKYVSPSPLEENLKLSPYAEQAVLDGRNMKNTYLIVYPNFYTLRPALAAAGINASSDDADLCADPAVNAWLLKEFQTNNMVTPVWKGYETARNMILDHEEWTTDNDLMTPSLKVKLRNLLTRHEDAIKQL
jgi:long-chain acyl-CoA synthetase